MPTFAERMEQQRRELLESRQAGAPQQEEPQGSFVERVERQRQELLSSRPPQTFDRTADPSSFGGSARRPVTFGESVRGGFKGYEASLQMALAMGRDMFGLENNEQIERAMQAYEHAADITAGAPTFGEFLDSPDFGNFADWFINTAGSFAPDVLESVTTGIIGGLAGAKLAGPPGAATGAAYGAVAGRTLLKANLRKEAREALQRVRDGTGTQADREIAHDLLRSSFAARGAAVGTTAGATPQLSGEAYRESVEAGDPSPFGALAVGFGASLVGTAGEAYAISAATRLMGQSLRTGSPLAEAGKVFFGSTAASTATELTQEEMMIRFRDTMERGYAFSEEAASRRLEAGAAGAAMGATRAGVFDAPATAFATGQEPVPGQEPPAGRLPPPEQPPGQPPSDDPSPTFTERFSNFMAQFDPAVDEQGFTTPAPRQQFTSDQAPPADPAPRQSFTSDQAPPADPAPRQQFTSDQAPPADPAPRQSFTSDQAPPADPAPRQSFTSDQAPPADPAPRQSFTSDQAPPADPAPSQQFNQRQDTEPTVTRADVEQVVTQEQRRALREAGYSPRDMLEMTGPTAQAMLDGRVPVERFREEMGRLRSGGIVSESQADIDAQFASMLDDNSPKRGIEVPDGSPLPSALTETDGVIEVETTRGRFFTRDPELAREVEEGGGDEATMARALGYDEPATQVDPRRAQVATARDAQGNIVHSEVVDGDRQRDVEARLRPMGEVSFESIQDHMLNRMTRRAQEDADDSQPRDMRMSDRQRQQQADRDPGHTLSVKDQRTAMRQQAEADSTPTVTAPTNERDLARGDAHPPTDGLQRRFQEDDANQPIPEPEREPGQELLEVVNQIYDLEQGMQDGSMPQSRENFLRLDGLYQQLEQLDPQLRQELESQTAEDAPTEERVRMFRHTRTEEQDDYTQEPRSQRRSSQPAVDETDALENDRATGQEELREGFQQPRVDEVGNPTTIGVRITPAHLSDAHVDTRNRGKEKGRTAVSSDAKHARVQHLAPKALGPRTEAETITLEDGTTTDVPASVARDLRKYQKQFPDDSWEIAVRDDGTGNDEFMIVRRRKPDTTAYTDRRTGEQVAFTDDTVETSNRPMTATQRIVQGLERARWRDRENPPDPKSKHAQMKLRDEKTGEEIWVNPDPLKYAGADVNRGTSDDPMRLSRGLATTLAILDNLGYRLAQWPAQARASGSDGRRHWDSFSTFAEIFGLPYNTLTPKIIDVDFNPSESTLTGQEQAALRKFWTNAPRSLSPRRKEQVRAKLGKANKIRYARRKNPKNFREDVGAFHRREINFLDAIDELRKLGHQVPAPFQMINDGEIRLPPELTDGTSFVLSGERAWATSRATDRWDSMTDGERSDILEHYGLDPELSTAALDEQTNDVIEAVNQLVDADAFEPAGDLVGTPDRRWEGAPRFFEEVPDTRNRSDIMDPDRPYPMAIPDAGHGARVHPAFQGTLGEVVRGIATLSKRLIGSKRNMIVVPWSDHRHAVNDIFASLPPTDFDILMGQPQIREDLESMLSGRVGTYATTMHIGSSSVVVVDPNLSPEMASVAVAHEMGHIVYRDHLGNLLNNKGRFRRLYTQFLNDRDAGLVAQYQEANERRAFEEWMADRYASWLQRRSRPNQATVAKAGAFADLREKLRSVFDGAKKLAAKLKRQGDMELHHRLQGSRAADNFFDKLAEIEMLRSWVHDLRRGAHTGRKRFDPETRAELDLVTQQLKRAEAKLASRSNVQRRLTQRVDALRERIQELQNPTASSIDPQQRQAELDAANEQLRQAEEQLARQEAPRNAAQQTVKALRDQMAQLQQRRREFELPTSGLQPEGLAEVRRVKVLLDRLSKMDLTTEIGAATRDHVIQDLKTALVDAQNAVRTPGPSMIREELRRAQEQIKQLEAELPRTGERVPTDEVAKAAQLARNARLRRDARTAAREAQQEQKRQEEEQAAAEIYPEQLATLRTSDWADVPVMPNMDGLPNPEAVDLTALVPPTEESSESSTPVQPGEGGGGAVPPTIGISNLPGLPEGPSNLPQPRLNPIVEAMNRQYEKTRTNETVINAARWADANMPRFMQRGWRVFKDLWWSDDSRLREMGGPGINIARMFWAAPGDTGQMGYLNAREAETGRWLQRKDAALEGLSPEEIDYAFRLIQEERPREQVPSQALPLYDLMTEIGQYGEKHIRGFKPRASYGTRVYNVGEIMSRTEAFQRLLREHMPDLTSRQITDIVHNLTQEGGAAVLETADQAGSAPGLSARFARQLNDIPNKALADAGFLEDPQTSITQHIKSMVRRAEAERRFAGQRPLDRVVNDMRRRQQQGHVIDTDYLRQLEAEMEAAEPGSMRMLHDPMAKVKDQIDNLPGEQQEMARKIVENYMGRSNRLLGYQMVPAIARAQSLIGAYVYMTTLGLATLSQFTDYATIAMRTRNKMAWRDMYRTLKEFPRADRAELAKRLGIVQSELTLSAMHNMYGNDYMTPGVRRATDMFFKLTGLQAMTDFNRALAAQMGIGFIKSAAQRANAAQFEGTSGGGQRQQGQAPDPTAVRHLQELGLTPDVVREWIASGEDFDTPAGQAVREAVFRFTDEAILRPNAAMRPGWASNPWFMLFWQLKSFAWGGKKVFIDGALNEFRQQRREGKSISEATAPMQMAVLMGMPLALLGLTARDMAKGAINNMVDDDDYEWISTNTNWATLGGATELMDRAGLLGPASIALGAYSGMEFGTPPLVGWAGPAAERTHRLLQGDYGRVARDSIPVAGLVL